MKIVSSDHPSCRQGDFFVEINGKIKLRGCRGGLEDGVVEFRPFVQKAKGKFLSLCLHLWMHGWIKKTFL